MRDRDLVRLHWPAVLRPAFDALMAIDDVMASVVANATQPALAAIKLAWWRERLEALDAGAVPAEPRLQAAARELLPLGITGAELGRLEAGWATLLQERPDTEVALGRGALLFALAARLLVDDPPQLLGSAGRIHAAATLHRRGLLPSGAFPMIDVPPIPRRLRPLTGLAALAARDLRRDGRPFEPEATPGRSLALLRHRFTGRL